MLSGDSCIKFLDSALLLTFVTVLLYCSSTAYVHGFFGALNLDGDVLDRNFHQILYHGMVLNFSTILLLPILLATLVTLHATYKIELSKFVRTKCSYGKRIIKLKRIFRIQSSQPSSLELKYRKRMRYSWAIVFVTFTFSLGMVYFESEGNAKAIEIQTLISNGNMAKLTLKSQKSKDLSILFCGARNCAASDKNGNIVYFPQNGHTVYPNRKHNKQL